MTAPAKDIVRADQGEKLALGELPVEVRQQITLRRMQREMAAQIAGQNWGAKLDHPTRMAVAAWCQERDVDPATEVDVLGSKPYRNHMWWRRKLAELIQAGLVQYAYPDHVHADERLTKLAKAGDTDAGFEENRRVRERIKYNIPDKAVAAVVYHIRLIGMHEDIVGAKWCGGGTRKNDPVGDAVPVETAESRAIRRACLNAVTFLPPQQRQRLEPIVHEELRLAEEIDGAKKRFRANEMRLVPLPSEPTGSFVRGDDQYGGVPTERLDPSKLAVDEGADRGNQEPSETRAEPTDAELAAEDARLAEQELPLGDKPRRNRNAQID